MLRVVLLLVLGLAGCPAPERGPAPVQAPQGPTEPEAKAALQKAVSEKSFDALLDVYHRYPKLPSGKEALKRAARMLIEEVKELAQKCDEATAKGKLARIAPFTLEDPEINEAYDDMQKQIVDRHAECALVQLDADVKKAEAAWDWAGVFARIAKAKDVDGATLKQRRLAAVARYKVFLESTARGLADGKITLDEEKRNRLLDSVDASKLPPEIEPELEAWPTAVRVLALVFHDFTEGKLVDPPKQVWLQQTSKARKLDAPDSEGPTIAFGAGFHVIARGTLDGKKLLVAGENKKDLIARLKSAKLLILEADTQPKKK